MTISCKYHPTRRAHWTCPNCDIAFCPHCVTEKKVFGTTSGHLCPKCNQPVEWVGVSNLIPPFWRRWSGFFLYPFHIHPMTLIVLLAVIEMIPLKGIFGILKPLFVWGMLFNYAFAALKNTARGDLKPPELDTFFNNASGGRLSYYLLQSLPVVFRQVGIYVIIGLIFMGLSQKVSIIAGGIFLVASLLFIPSMLILLVTTDSFLNAINPLLFTQLALRIGKGYLLMYFFLILLGVAPAALWSALPSSVPSFIGQFIANLARSYYTIVSYHLMGYVLLQYHEDVGYEVSYEDFNDPSAQKAGPADPGETVLNQVDVQLKEGNFDKALFLIEEVRGNGGIRDLRLAERYFKLLKLRKQTPRMLEHGKTYLEQLVRENHKQQACKVYSACLQSDKAFTPSSSALFRLGSWLRETGRNREAISAYSRFTQAYPDAPTVPTAYFRAAGIFHEQLSNTPKARQILTGVVRKYPDHEIIPFVRDYLKTIREK